MNLEELHDACMALPGVTEGFPFDEMTLVMRVGERMFALINLENHDAIISLKCDPDRAIELRSRYEGIVPAYHMNKKHWNGVNAESDVPTALVLELIRHSYDLVLAKLPRAKRAALNL